MRLMFRLLVLRVMKKLKIDLRFGTFRGTVDVKGFIFRFFLVRGEGYEMVATIGRLEDDGIGGFDC